MITTSIFIYESPIIESKNSSLWYAVQSNILENYIKPNFLYINMQFNKKVKVGVFLLCLLLIFTTGISLIDIDKQNNVVDRNSLSLSALEDGYEPNNFMGSAYDLTAYNDNWLSWINLNGTLRDDDWYNISVTGGNHRVRLNLTYTYALGDISMELWNSTMPMIMSNTTTDDEFIDFIVPADGIYSIKVFGFNPVLNNTYDLWWNTTLPPDDLYEENDISGYDPQYTLSSYEGKWLSEINGIGIQADDDWYTIYMPTEREKIIIELENLNPASGYIDMELYDAGVTLNGSSFNVANNTKKIEEFIPTDGGYYFIKVFGDDNSTSYDLKWYSIASDDLYDDGVGNDYKWDASYISPATMLDDLIQKDDDWYEIYVAPGKELIYAELASLGNIQMQLYNNNNSYPIYWSFYKDGKEIIDTYASSGTYYIRVYGNNVSNSYDLLWEDLSTRYPEEYFEPNNNYLTAFDISGPGNETMAHRGIQWNDDWFQIYAEERIHADLNYDFMSGQDINFEILYYNGTDIELIAWMLGNNTSIDIPIPWNGTYYIRVFGNNSGGRYELSWQSTTFSSSYGDDAYEPNNFKGQAYYLSPFAASWLPDGLGIQFDDDWYEVFLDPGEERIYIELSFSHALGNIDIEVYNDSSPDPIAGSYSLDDNEYIDVNVTMFGKYFIRVFGDNASNPYDLWWEDLSPTEMDDYYEENDFEGNISLELYDDSQSLLVSSNSSDNYAFVDFELQKSGTYYIHVFGENKGNWYDLKWRTQDEAKDFYDDSYEDNNEFYKAYSLWDDERTWLRNIAGLAVQGDEDWYLIDVSAGFLHLKVDVIFNHSAGDIDIEIYEVVNFDEVNPVIENNSRTDNEYINYTLSHPGVYFIVIFGENVENEYDLWWDDLRTIFDEDIYEPNDSYLNATDITANDNYEKDFSPRGHGGPKISADGTGNDILSLRTSDGLGLQYDEDWYEIYVPEERLTLMIGLQYDYAEGVMGLIVYDSDYREIAENFTKHDGEFIIINLRLNGTYYIRVFGDNTGNVYDLMWATSELPIENIPGYDILILLGSLFGIVSIIAI
ncbi:hypothetical protein LCGC14_0937220, partial [marine sediment metagenome]